MERDPLRRRRRFRLLAGLVLVALLGPLAFIEWRTRRVLDDGTRPAAARATSPAARAPEGVRVRVEILNTTKTRGMARRAMRVLRDHGYDVVGIGSGGPPSDSTVVIDRTGHPDWARRVAAALGGARIETRPDSSRYLDLTVLLGGAWRPAPETLYP